MNATKRPKMVLTALAVTVLIITLVAVWNTGAPSRQAGAAASGHHAEAVTVADDAGGRRALAAASAAITRRAQEQVGRKRKRGQCT